MTLNEIEKKEDLWKWVEENYTVNDPVNQEFRVDSETYNKIKNLFEDEYKRQWNTNGQVIVYEHNLGTSIFIKDQ